MNEFIAALIPVFAAVVGFPYARMMVGALIPASKLKDARSDHEKAIKDLQIDHEKEKGEIKERQAKEIADLRERMQDQINEGKMQIAILREERDKYRQGFEHVSRAYDTLERIADNQQAVGYVARNLLEGYRQRERNAVAGEG